MPVHVYDKHIGRNVISFELSYNIFQFKVIVKPVTAPPIAEGPFWGKRNPASDFHIIADCGKVVVSVGKNVQVLTLSLRPFGHPAVLCKNVTLTLIHNCPSVTGNDTLVKHITCKTTVRILNEITVKLIQRASGSHEIGAIVHTGMPHCCFSVHTENYLEVVRAESPIAFVFQLNGFRDYPDSCLSSQYLEVWNRQITIYDSQGSPVFEYPIFGPLHTDKLRSEHSKTGITTDHNRFLACSSIPLRKRRECDAKKHNQPTEAVFHN